MKFTFSRCNLPSKSSMAYFLNSFFLLIFVLL